MRIGNLHRYMEQSTCVLYV